MKKTLMIGLPVALVLGLVTYGQVAGWYDARNLYHPSVEEGRAIGSVENLQSLTLIDKDKTGKLDHVTIFTLVGEDGTVLNLGIDYDNFAFKDGDRLEIIYAKKVEEEMCNRQLVDGPDAKTHPYRARWYRLVNYKFVKSYEPTPSAEHGSGK